MLAVEPEIIEKFVRTGNVKLVFRDVLNHGERSERASEAAACAGEQGYFWDMHSVLFSSLDQVWGTGSEGLVDLMTQFGGSLTGLDGSSYQQCLLERRTLETLKAADAEQRTRGIVSQPVFVIGEQRLFGLQTFELISGLIEAELNK